jgi:hypothetical protein
MGVNGTAIRAVLAAGALLVTVVGTGHAQAPASGDDRTGAPSITPSARRSATAVVRPDAAVVPRHDSSAVARRLAIAPQRGYAPLSPGEAFAVGLAATAGPALVALAVDPPGRNSDFAPEAALTVGIGAGILAGPAIGLWSGGRGDLAKRGLIVRGVGVIAVGAGALGLLSAIDGDTSTGAVNVLAIVGVAGLAVTTVSSLYDLAITPSAIAKRPPLHAQLGVRPDGVVAVRVRF